MSAAGQPVVRLTLAALAGIAIGYRLGPGFAAGPAARAALAAALAALLLCRRPWKSPLLPPLLFLLLGIARAQLSAAGRAAEQLRLAPYAEAPAVRATLRVDSEAIPDPRARRSKSPRLTFAAGSLSLAPDPARALPACAVRSHDATVLWYGGRDAIPQPGETWEMKGRLRFRRRRNGTAELTLTSAADRARRLAAPATAAWRTRIAGFRREASRRVSIGIEHGLGGYSFIPALNQAIILGMRNEIPADIRRVFAASGTVHVFAISGLHIALIAALLLALIRQTGLPRTLWVYLLAPPLVGYTILTGARPSAVRACAMALVYLYGSRIGRKPDALAALSLTALAIHLADPMLIFDLGSLFSFTVMAGLVVFTVPFSRLLARAGNAVLDLRQIEERCALARRPAGVRACRLLRGAGRFLNGTLAVSLAAWLASVPITAYYFGRFTPGSLLANLVISPSAFWLMILGCAGLAASYVCTPLAAAANILSGCFTWLMVTASKLTAACPFLTYRIAKWNAAEVFLFYLGLFLLHLLLNRKPSAPRAPDWLPPAPRP